MHIMKSVYLRILGRFLCYNFVSEASKIVVYIYIYIYTYIHTHTYPYLYISKSYHKNINILEFYLLRSQNYSKATTPGFSNSKVTAPGTNVCGKNGGGKGGKVVGKAKSRSSRLGLMKTK